jgi:hypothetical protein
MVCGDMIFIQLVCFLSPHQGSGIENTQLDRWIKIISHHKPIMGDPTCMYWLQLISESRFVIWEFKIYFKLFISHIVFFKLTFYLFLLKYVIRVLKISCIDNTLKFSINE